MCAVLFVVVTLTFFFKENRDVTELTKKLRELCIYPFNRNEHLDLPKGVSGLHIEFSRYNEPVWDKLLEILRHFVSRKETSEFIKSIKRDTRNKKKENEELHVRNQSKPV
ncbi:hypothetical protein ADIARSV_2839 [Arcticibacter svalbardensis MN12-7]|uniref:Uncharacterized protein n=1 Tax=Arcticibacter svalbardensis MN12-7 TaxID=1150600 RepID=R9GR24_9SPHI|nr:hypothetical protein ADIARSV_2839 [Arcticibacter svalbardensis MN12-7]